MRISFRYLLCFSQPVNKRRATPSPSPASGTAWTEQWDRFWFLPSDPKALSILRIGLASLAACWILSLWNELPRWFAAEGLLPPSTTRELGSMIFPIDQWRWSPLELIGSAVALRAFLAVAVVIAAGVALGFGGRWLAAALLLCTLMIVHRGAPVMGAGPTPLVLGLLSVVLGTPHANGLRSLAGPAPWSGMALRLAQFHLGLLLIAQGLAAWAEPVWREGEAAGYLMSAWSGINPLADRLLQPSIVNLMTHGMLLTVVVALVALSRPAAWRWLLGSGLAYAAWLLILAGQWLYAGSIASMVVAVSLWQKNRSPSLRSAVI